MSELKIHVEDIDSVFARARGVARQIDAGAAEVAEFHLSFDHLGLLLKTLTTNRWTLLGALRRHGPWSIQALAGALGRDYKAVHTDVMALIEAGLVERADEGLVSVPWSRISAEVDLEAA